MTIYSDDNFSISIKMDTEPFENACEMASRFTAEFSGWYWFSTGRVMEATYDRPTTATLMVKCANGDEWEATPKDLEKFDFIDRMATFRTLRTALVNLLKNAGLFDEEYRDLDHFMLRPMQELAETALLYPDELNSPSMDIIKNMVAQIERTLREGTIYKKAYDGEEE